MDTSRKSGRMCCYRCSRCQLEVYRHYVHYDRRDRPICDPDCDGTKPGTCIWCEQVIVGRPMLMFEKKVHRECWQYCVAKFGYDEIVRRYKSDDWEEFREREVGEDMVREMVEEFFDKFCTGLVSDEEDTTIAEDVGAMGMCGKRGEEEWGRAIRMVIHNKKHASLPNISCTNEFKGEPVCGGSDPCRNTEEVREECSEETPTKEMPAESRNEKTKLTHRLHSAGERTEWLQAVQKSVCGDTFFDRESWADEAYRNTLGHNRDPRDVTTTEDRRRRRRHHHGESSAGNSTSLANTFEGQQGFVDSIIEEAVSVVKECNDNDVYKTIRGRPVVNYDEVWERATRKKNDTLMVGTTTGKQGKSEDLNSVCDVNYVRNVLSSCETSVVDQVIDEAAGNYRESSDEECIRCTCQNLRACEQRRVMDERIKSVFSKGWEDARKFRAMYEEPMSLEQSTNCARQCCQQDVCNDDVNSSVTVVGGNENESKKTSNKRRRRRKKPNGEETSAETPSGHELNSNVDDLVYESVSQDKTIETSKSDLVLGKDVSNVVDGTVPGATSIADTGVEHILTEDQLDELFGNALMTSGDPVRLGRLMNEFKSAVANIQHNTNTCRECPRSRVSSASENDLRQSARSATDQFDTVLAQLMDEVHELNNSILIFHKFTRPDHFIETSVSGDLLSSPQGEVYGTGNVLIIFDYGEEPLESDLTSVYEYLANICHEKDSPRCFLHRTSQDRFNFSNMSEGNLSLYNGTDTSDSASTYRDVTLDVSDDATSRFISPQDLTSLDLENMSSYDETLWAETQRGRRSSLRSLQGSSRLSGDVFCTDVEAQAWRALLNAGKSEEDPYVDIFGDLSKDLEESEENVEHSEVRNEKNEAEVSLGDSGSLNERSWCDERSRGGKSAKRTDAQLLDQVRSIKRINFDDSVTSLRATTSTGEPWSEAIIVRKSVSESDVSSYELCTCSCVHLTDSSCSGRLRGSTSSDCDTTTTTTWHEVRQIVTEVASTHLQHSASLGANKEPTDVYQIAIEITVTKKPEQKCQKPQDIARRRSSIDMLSFFQESTKCTDKVSDSFNELYPKFKHKTQEPVTNGQLESVNNQVLERKCSNKITDSERFINKVVAATETNYLVDGSSGHSVSCNESSCKNKSCSRPLNDFNTESTGSEREIIESMADKLDNMADNIYLLNLFCKESRNLLCMGSNKHGVDSNKSSEINFFRRRSSKKLDVEGKSCETGNRKHPSKFRSIDSDVDLFSSASTTIRGERTPHHMIIDGISSNEDIFRTGWTDGKFRLDGSTETPDSSGQYSSVEKEERQVVFLKEQNENIVEEILNEKLSSGQENKDLFNVEDGSSGSGNVDLSTSNEVGNNYPYEHNIGRRGSKHEEILRPHRSKKEIHVESLLDGGEIALEKSGAYEIDVGALASGKNIDSRNSCRQNIGRKTSSEETNSEMSRSDRTNVADGSNVGEVGPKSCEESIENVEIRESVDEVPTTQNVATNEQDASYLSIERIFLGRSYGAEGSVINLQGEDISSPSTKELEFDNITSLQTDSKTAKDNDIDFKALAENYIFLESSNVPRAVQNNQQAGIDHDTSKHTDAVIETPVKLKNAVDTSETPEAGLETRIASIEYVDSPMKAQVSSKKSSLNVNRANDACKSALEYDFEKEVCEETEIGCMNLCDEDDEFEEHSTYQHDSVIRESQRRLKQAALNAATQKKLEKIHRRFMNDGEIDIDFSSLQNVSRKSSSTTTGSDLESYKGNITEEEREVYMVLSASEYDVGHEWPSECGSDPNIACEDTDVASVLTAIRDGSSAKRGAGVGGEEKSRDERITNEPLTDGEKVTQPSSSNATKTSGIIHESKRKDLKDRVNKKSGLNAKKEKKKKKALLIENLDEICKLDDDKNDADENVRVRESTEVQVVPPSGKKSKRKKDKRVDKDSGGRRKGSPTCVIL